MIALFQPLRLWLPVTGGRWSAAGFFRSVLCSVRGPGGVLCSSFSRGSYPTVWFASPSWFVLVTGGAFLPITKRCSLYLPRLPAMPPLVSGRCRCLCCFSTGGVTVGLVIFGFNYLFIFPACYVALCASKACHRLGRETVSWCLETSLLKIPFQGQASLPRMELPPHLLCLFFRLLYFFLPVFEDNDLLFWVPDVLCQHSEVVS